MTTTAKSGQAKLLPQINRSSSFRFNWRDAREKAQLYEDIVDVLKDEDVFSKKPSGKSSPKGAFKAQGPQGFDITLASVASLL